MWQIFHFLCKSNHTFPRIICHPSTETKVVEEVCWDCDKITKRETYRKAAWGYELIREEFF